jgi:hypothetical protein
MGGAGVLVAGGLFCAILFIFCCMASGRSGDGYPPEDDE